MNNTDLFTNLLNNLKGKIHLLKDKPEETEETTLKALWLAAAGIPVSAERAVSCDLPELTEKQLAELSRLIEQRLGNKPLAHITHRQNFMGIDMIADHRALIPRKETEILGKKSLELSRSLSEIKGKIYVMDICCGSGNLGISVAYYNPQTTVFCADLSEEAVSLARENIDFLGLAGNINARQSDLLAEFESDEFYNNIDLLICNPPYIQTSKVEKMDSEIASFEPSLAFDGGMLGIRIIQRLISVAPKFLTEEGWLIFEVGAGQNNFIAQLCERTQLYKNIESITDNYGTGRVILAQRL